MSHWELSEGLTDEYYTPKVVITALGVIQFDVDLAAPTDPQAAFIPAKRYISSNGLEAILDKKDFVWCNPPYGARGSKMAWIEKMIIHNNGLLLTPDRSNGDWWQVAGKGCTAMLTTYDKIKFVGPYGVPHIGKNGKPALAPGTGNSIFAFGERALKHLIIAQNNYFGMIWKFTKI